MGLIGKFVSFRPGRGTASVLAQRIWQGAAGLVTLACITRFLTPVEQGFYYTFASLAAVQTLLDMGLSVVLVQVAAHEFVGLRWGARGEGVVGGRRRFLALARKAFFWYAVAALVFLLAYPIGLVLLDVPNTGLGYDWHTPWLLLILATALSLVFLPFLAVVEGTGEVAEVYSVRLAQGVCGATAIWLTLYRGGGLYAVIMMPAASAVVGCAWLLFRRPGFVRQIMAVPSASYRWRSEVWPMQWRLGVSWMCSYLIMHIHTPLLFRLQGPVVAGQMGLSLTVANMIGLFAMVGATSATPALARSAAEGDWFTLDVRFKRVVLFAVTVYLLGALSFFLVRVVLDSTPYGARFLPLWLIAVLLLAIFASNLIGLLGVYLRAHRREPFMALSIVSAILVVAGVCLAVPYYGAAANVLVMLLVNTFIALPAAAWLWFKLRRDWH